jgi:hypothetical protein
MAVKRRVHREAVDVVKPSERFIASMPERIMLCLALAHFECLGLDAVTDWKDQLGKSNFECNGHFRSDSPNQIPLISQPEMKLRGASLASVRSVNWPRRSDQD